MRDITFSDFSNLSDKLGKLVLTKIKSKKKVYWDYDVTIFKDRFEAIFKDMKEFYVNPWFVADKTYFTKNKFLISIQNKGIDMFIDSKNLTNKGKIFDEINSQISAQKKVVGRTRKFIPGVPIVMPKIHNNNYFPYILYYYKSYNDLKKDKLIKKYSVNEMVAFSGNNFVCWNHEGEIFSSKKLRS
jgi:hypothetical protein